MRLAIGDIEGYLSLVAELLERYLSLVAELLERYGVVLDLEPRAPLVLEVSPTFSRPAPGADRPRSSPAM